MKRWFTVALLAVAGSEVRAEFQGSVSGQFRWFPQTPLDEGQHDSSASLAVQPEWYRQLDNGSLNLKVFYRHDSADADRRHGDIREAYWQYVAKDYEFTLGINKVFWGVTESRHLVDIINQTDGVEAPDGEEKLGQPMAHLALLRDWGVVDIFLLPGFRERSYPGTKGRLRSHPRVVEKGRYASGAEDQHVDLALRWSHYFGDLSLGLSAFRGTARDPLFELAQVGGELVLRPYYAQIQQSALDAQYVTGDWLWKLEAIYRDYREADTALQAQSVDYAASTVGFEKTHVGILGSDWDVGWIAEYSYDTEDSTPALAKNSLFLGARLGFNDIAGSEVLLGLNQNLDDDDSRLAYIEASSRIGSATRLSIEAAHFSSEGLADPLSMLRRDSYVELTLERFF